jgi:hypothetical protein
LLQTHEEKSELDEVDALVLMRESILDLLRDLGVCQDTSVGRLRLVVAAGERASMSDLVAELHDRLEEVGKQPEGLVKHGQELKLPRRVVAVVADGATDDGVVFLFDVAVIVLVIVWKRLVVKFFDKIIIERRALTSTIIKLVCAGSLAKVL